MRIDTLEQIFLRLKKQIIGELQRTNRDLVETDLGIETPMALAHAAEFRSTQQRIAQILLEATPQTATFLLDDYGKVKGVFRRVAQIGIYNAQFTFSGPQIIPAQTLFTSANGILLTNENDVISDRAGQIIFAVRTLERGFANIKSDENINMNVALKTVSQNGKIVAIIQSALGDESDAEYRLRVSAEYDKKTLYGTATYMRVLLSQIPEVVGVYPYPAVILGENSLNTGLGYPLIYIESATGKLSQTTMNLILNKLSVSGVLCGGEITVLDCEICKFSLEITTQYTQISDIESTIRRTANDYLSGKRPYVANIDESDDSIISYYDLDLLIRNAVKNSGLGEVASVLLFANSNRVTQNYVLSRGEIPAPDVEIRSGNV